MPSPASSAPTTFDADGASSGSWFCPTALDRARLLENTGRVARARTITVAASSLTLLLFVPQFGWWAVPIFALLALNTQTLDARTARSPHPEYHVAFSVLSSQCLLACAVAISGGPDSPVLPLIAVPTAFAATRFRAPVVMLGVATAIVCMLAATLALDPSQTIASPNLLLVSFTLLVAITAAVSALSGAEVLHRSESVLDPLTGLLNRSALEQRFNELAAQARQTGEPVTILVCDLDHFKAINDMHGHAEGDAVLRDVADEIRKQLRSFELVYRLGGEEFLVLLPGATPMAGAELGERLRGAIELCRPGGATVTVSIGIETAYGADVDYEPMFAAADAALYAAKDRGRNRVVSPAKPPGSLRPLTA